MAQFGLQTYRITQSRLKRSLSTGFELTPKGELIGEPEVSNHRCILTKLDSNTPDCPWGRLALESSLETGQLLTIRSFASNDCLFFQQGKLTQIDDFLQDEEVPLERKETLFTAGEGVQFTGVDDVLLFGQTGRYLWIWLEVTGRGKVSLSNLRVMVPGDNFYNTFPQVYRNDGEFFHRYLAIFSTLYNDFQEKIDHLHHLVEVETAPEPVLKILGTWLGLELESAMLTEEELRRILLHGYELLCTKGTRWGLEKLISLLVEEKFYIVERNQLSPEQLEGMGNQYGSSPFHCTLLINRPEDEGLRNKLTVLVGQFTPFRSQVQIIFLGDGVGLDSFAYLDINSKVAGVLKGNLDEGRGMTGDIYLQ